MYNIVIQIMQFKIINEEFKLFSFEQISERNLSSFLWFYVEIIQRAVDKYHFIL